MQNFGQNDAISMTEGKIIVDGEVRTNGISAKAAFTINTVTVKALGARSEGNKPVGYKITGTLTEYRATRWLIDICKEYQNTGVIKPFNLQGVIEDKTSMYYRENGTTRDTFVNCMLTGDIPILDINAQGETMTEEINFTAEKII